MAKTKWEKCPISDILDKLTNLLQIRQVSVSLCDNEPYLNFDQKWSFITIIPTRCAHQVAKGPGAEAGRRLAKVGAAAFSKKAYVIFLYAT